MKNTLADLNDYLFETLERLLDDDLTEEQMQREITRSRPMARSLTVILSSGRA